MSLADSISSSVHIKKMPIGEDVDSQSSSSFTVSPVISPQPGTPGGKSCHVSSLIKKYSNAPQYARTSMSPASPPVAQVSNAPTEAAKLDHDIHSTQQSRERQPRTGTSRMRREQQMLCQGTPRRLFTQSVAMLGLYTSTEYVWTKRQRKTEKAQHVRTTPINA